MYQQIFLADTVDHWVTFRNSFFYVLDYFCDSEFESLLIGTRLVR